MVIAEKWAEQRVLMRAYAESRDQTLPTITLHGIELDRAGWTRQRPWGTVVAPDGCPGDQGRSKRPSGSPAKGGPPRLPDESTFERADGNWDPARHAVVAASGSRTGSST
jgi:hypothetical protein